MEFKSSSAAAPRRPMAVLCVAAVILQIALAPQLSVLGGRINFMLVLTVVLAVAGDARSMVYVGFLSGLFFDLTSASPVGLMSLLLCLAGYMTAALSRGVAPGPSMEAMRCAGISILLVNLVYGLALFFMGQQTSLLYALGVHGLASSVLDFIVAFAVMALVPAAEQGHGFSASRGQQRLSVRSGSRGHGTRFKGMR